MGRSTLNMKWDARFLHLAEHIATWSKDPSTKVGAVVVRPDKTICSTGYNGFPRGLDDSQHLYDQRSVKIERVVHAEMNAILTAPEPVKGYTLYCTLLPCAFCAKLVIQAGITRFVAPEPGEDIKERWQFDTSMKLLQEADVELLIMTEGNL
jgi:dCMP deaminase